MRTSVEAIEGRGGPPGETSQRLLVSGLAELMSGGEGLQCDGQFQWTNHGWEEEDVLALENRCSLCMSWVTMASEIPG